MLKLIPFLFLPIVACTTRDSGTTSGGQTSSTPTTSPTAGVDTSGGKTETAVAPEVNPPGDIPDTQAFVKYTSAAGGYHLEVPEGWARTEAGPNVTFTSKFNGLNVAVSSASSAPTAASVRDNEAKLIQMQARAATIVSTSEVNLPAGKAVAIKYSSNSEPNAVTSKRIRLESIAYLFFRNGTQVSLTVWAPQGADNVDQWNRIARSFGWQ